MPRAAAAALLLLLATTAMSAEPRAGNFVDVAKLDLTVLLPPPPAADSAQTKAELAEIHDFEKTRTPERVKIAQDDETETVFAVVHGDLGEGFTAERLPVTAAFFKRVLADEGVVVDPAKTVWGRARPHIADPTVKLCVKASKSNAYPSGHATVGYLSALVLGDMLPARRPVLFADAQRFAESRVVCGIHYRSDIEASRSVAALMAFQIRQNPIFQKEFAAVAAELRAAHIGQE